jgi:putative Mg2+ transporter-C (MgtC) family protein
MSIAASFAQPSSHGDTDCVPDLNELLRDPQVEALLRVLLAGLLAGLIGFEREVEGKPAGIRTYGLVGMGAAMFTTGGILVFGAGEPASRVAAQIVTGIGFIGAGTILHLRSGVVGLTTAAGLWVAAAVGLVIGGGQYILGIGSALALLLVLFVLKPSTLERLGIKDEENSLNVGEGRPDDTRKPESPSDS